MNLGIGPREEWVGGEFAFRLGGFDKKAVPNIDKFSGKDEDYFTWRESTINILGNAGFGRFLDESAMAVKHPEVAESVFYSLRGAVHGGQAQSTAQGMLDDKQLLPEKLCWRSTTTPR